MVFHIYIYILYIYIYTLIFVVDVQVTVRPGSPGQFYIVSYDIKWVKTYWTTSRLKKFKELAIYTLPNALFFYSVPSLNNYASRCKYHF